MRVENYLAELIRKKKLTGSITVSMISDFTSSVITLIGASPLNALSDVNIITPTLNDVLTWNGTEWVNFPSSSIKIDTEVNIKSTPASLNYATDTRHLFIYDTALRQIGPPAESVSINPHIGYTQYPINYSTFGADFIGNKKLVYVDLSSAVIKGSNRQEEGAIRYAFDSSTNRNELQIYRSGAFQNIMAGIRLNTDENNELEVLVADRWVNANTGNSDKYSLSGYPIVLDYKVSIGAFSSPIFKSYL